jgi:hypothetical protein
MMFSIKQFKKIIKMKKELVVGCNYLKKENLLKKYFGYFQDY